MPKAPCFLCGRQLDQRTDKNGKPYFICDPCGMQIFIRRKTGIENLTELLRTLRGRDLPFREHARVLFEIQAVLIEIRGVKKEIEILDEEIGFFSRDKERKAAQKLLKTRLKRLVIKLGWIVNEGRPAKRSPAF